MNNAQLSIYPSDGQADLLRSFETGGRVGAVAVTADGLRVDAGSGVRFYPPNGRGR